VNDTSRADPAIAQMTVGSALPRRSGELVFHEDWERRAFGLAVALADAGHFHWSDFQARLIEAIAEAERENPQRPSRGYFESWLAALESLLGDSELLQHGSIDRR
jgi:nitrile hydratase accessory protein